MNEPEPDSPGARGEQRFEDAVRRKAERRRRRRDERSVWFWFGMFGMVGWSVSAPAVAFTALGVWLDARWPGRVSWTLTLLFAGVVVGCLVAWYWVREESEER